MLTLFLRVIGIAFLCSILYAMSQQAHSQVWNQQTVGPFTYYNGTDRNGGQWNGTSQQLGPFNYQNFIGPNGQTKSCTSQRLGSMVYTNCN